MRAGLFIDGRVARWRSRTNWYDVSDYSSAWFVTHRTRLVGATWPSNPPAKTQTDNFFISRMAGFMYIIALKKVL